MELLPACHLLFHTLTCCARPMNGVICRAQVRSSIKNHSTRSKSYDDIPAKKGFLPAWMNLIKSGGPGYLHEHCDRLHQELGPIFKERLGTNELLFIADTKMIKTVIANEGPWPHHNVPEAWILYNKVNNIERGIFFQVGEPWAKLRRAFNKVLLADYSKISRFSDDILKINSDLLDCWERQSNFDNTFVVHDIKSQLCNWSIEATGLMLFGTRMGCIRGAESTLNESRAEKLVEHVANMFTETSKFQILPCRVAQKYNLSTWRRFQVASEGMLKLATDYANEFILKAKQSSSNRSLVKDLLLLGSLDDEEISRSVVDLIIASADTTSNSLQWMLYCLTKYPNVQDKLFQELHAISSPESFHNIKQSAPYLSAFIKEVSRLYPTAPFLARTLDHEITLDGYKIPAGVTIVFSLYTTSRMSDYFENPLEFRLERWLRENTCPHDNFKKVTNHAFASLPFGIGSRMCIGRRMADLELHLLIASFVLRYQSYLEGNDDIKIKLKMILSPDKPINLKLIRRKGHELKI